MIKEKNTYIANIYYMLSYAYRSLRHKAFEPLSTESFDNMPDMCAAIMAKAVAALLKRGMSREYITVRAPLSALRGRIDIPQTLGAGGINSRKLHCAYDELSENHAMNRILKTALLQLIRCDLVKPCNRAALKKLVLFFSGIDALDPSAIPWQTLRYHRNNEAYQLLMGICYLVLHELLLTTDRGERVLASFLDDQKMHKLFESFVREYYRTEHKHLSSAAKQIDWDTHHRLDLLPKMQSDTTLFDAPRKLIIDTKFYGQILQRQYDKPTFRSMHLYQIFTYVHSEDRQRTGHISGLLLYAQTDNEDPVDAWTDLSGNWIGIQSLDLSADFSAIRAQLDAILEAWPRTAPARTASS